MILSVVVSDADRGCSRYPVRFAEGLHTPNASMGVARHAGIYVANRATALSTTAAMSSKYSQQNVANSPSATSHRDSNGHV